MIKFSGFSTKNKKAINHVLVGKDLVIEDLMNELMTRKGERLMMPTFGSIIHDMVFEPLTVETKKMIMDDLERIVMSEPRCELISMEVTESDHTLAARIVINILPTNEVAQLKIDLERE